MKDLKISDEVFKLADKEGSAREFVRKLLNLLSVDYRGLKREDEERIILEIVRQNGLEPFFKLKGKNLYNALRKALKEKIRKEQNQSWETKIRSWRDEFEEKLRQASVIYLSKVGSKTKVRKLFEEGWIVPSDLVDSNFNDIDIVKRTGEWWHLKAFKRRKSIFEDILRTYQENMIEISIYAIFPQIEGVVWDSFVRDNLLESDIESLIRKRNRKFVTVQYALKIIIEDTVGEGDIPYYLKCVKFVDFKDNGTLNRHTVQHGVSINFGTKENFLRLFFLLDFLNEILTTVKEI